MSADDALRMARALQDRLHAALRPSPPRTPEEFRADIQALLINASDEGALSTPPYEILGLLKYSAEGHRALKLVSLSCGPAMDKGEAGGSFLHKPDGSRLSFGVQVSFEGHESGVLLAYRFHLQLQAGTIPPFLRIDLNREPAVHEPLYEPRYHIHPGSDDIRFQIPPMTPFQVIHKMIYGVLVEE